MVYLSQLFWDVLPGNSKLAIFVLKSNFFQSWDCRGEKPQQKQKQNVPFSSIIKGLQRYTLLVKSFRTPQFFQLFIVIQVI